MSHPPETTPELTARLSDRAEKYRAWAAAFPAGVAHASAYTRAADDLEQAAAEITRLRTALASSRDDADLLKYEVEQRAFTGGRCASKVRDLRAKLDKAQAEIAQARSVLNPTCDHETLIGAIRNLQQAHLSEQGNCETLEAKLTASLAEQARIREALKSAVEFIRRVGYPVQASEFRGLIHTPPVPSQAPPQENPCPACKAVGFVECNGPHPNPEGVGR